MKPPPAKSIPIALAGSMAAGAVIVAYPWVALHAANYASCVVSWLLVFYYATRVKWERSLTGWNMMTLACSLATLTSVGVARRLLGDGADEIAAAAYLGVAVAAAWTILTIHRVQRENHEQRVRPGALIETERRPRP